MQHLESKKNPKFIDLTNTKHWPLGQYYIPVNTDTMEWVDSHDYGNGSKLMEHSYIGNDFVEAVEMLLLPGARWDKARIVWAGDYADNIEGEDINYYMSAEDKNKLHELIRACPADYHYLVNFDKMEYVDKRKAPKFGKEYDWQVHPLPLLVADGNGRGGGDYHGHNEETVGCWTGDRIGVRKEIPEGFIEIIPNFTES